MSQLTGKVVALLGTGSDTDRALAVAFAEAGADLALGTTHPTQAQEFAMNSIANETWAIGREHFVALMEATDGSAAAAFADQAWDRYGRCDILVVSVGPPTTAPLDELSPDEWRDTLEERLTAPFLVAHAFGRLMERAGGGRVVFLVLDADNADAASLAASNALSSVVQVINGAWGHRGVSAVKAHGSAAGPNASAKLVLGTATRP